MIHFRATCSANVTEYWCIEEPDGWEAMSEGDRLAWLADNVDSADFRAGKVDGEKERTVLDYHGS
jgi:hypothetical protein